MNKDAFLDALKMCKIGFRLNEPMDVRTTFKIGGPADIFIDIQSVRELSHTLSAAREYSVPCFILGRGSNLLVSDSGVEGAVLRLTGLDSVSFDGCIMTCGAGGSLLSACEAAREHALSGLEFAFGIPGSVGGALFMNAGAYGGEMSQCVVSAECVDRAGKTLVLSRDEMLLGYRTSVFKSAQLVVASVSFGLMQGEQEIIGEKMKGYMNIRRQKQPLDYPSAGSTFKRPTGGFAGTLIEKSGLKGVRVGGAQVSEKHAGFIVNTGGATCCDVQELIRKVQDVVRGAEGVELEPEVISVGRE